MSSSWAYLLPFVLNAFGAFAQHELIGGRAGCASPGPSLGRPSHSLGLLQRQANAQQVLRRDARRTCTVYGDPHIQTFDQDVEPGSLLGRESNQSVSETHFIGQGDFWLVKSTEVLIQARYSLVAYPQALQPDNHTSVTSLAVAGPFLKGNTIVIEPRMGRVYWIGPGHSVRSEILMSTGSSFVLGDVINATYDRTTEAVQEHLPLGHDDVASVELDLPSNVHISVNRFAKHLDVSITMPRSAAGNEGVDGQCGNFNEDPADDIAPHVQARFSSSIAQSEQLFDAGWPHEGLCTVSMDVPKGFDAEGDRLLDPLHRPALEVQPLMSSGEYWLVKSKLVSIQAQYRIVHHARGDARPQLTAVSVGGAFMSGNALLIQPRDGKAVWQTSGGSRMELLAEQSKPDLTGYSGLAAAWHEHVWQADENRSILSEASRVELPLGVTLQVNRFAHHLDLAVIMSRDAAGPGEVRGLCGNFNGNAADDAVALSGQRASLHMVAEDERIFNQRRDSHVQACLIYGNSHVVAFDEAKVAQKETALLASTDEAGNGRAWWIMTSDLVHIQGRFEPRPAVSHNDSYLVELAVAGPLLGGHKLLIRPRNGKVLWYEKGEPCEVLARNGDAFTVDGIIEARYHNITERVNDPAHFTTGIDVELPASVRLEVNRYPLHLDIQITLPREAAGSGELDGICGNYNGDPQDDIEEAVEDRMHHAVKPDESLFESRVGASQSQRSADSLVAALPTG